MGLITCTSLLSIFTFDGHHKERILVKLNLHSFKYNKVINKTKVYIQLTHAHLYMNNIPKR